MFLYTRRLESRLYNLLFAWGGEEFFGAAGEEGGEVFVEDGEFHFAADAGDELAFIVLEHEAAFDGPECSLRELDSVVFRVDVFAEDVQVVFVKGF